MCSGRGFLYCCHKQYIFRGYSHIIAIIRKEVMSVKLSRARAREETGHDDHDTDRPVLYPHDAAKVFGVHRDTFKKWIRNRRFNIRTERYTNGVRYDMEDVFKAAYPGASDDQIAQLMFEYNMRKIQKRV